jgi:hypothetical protein
LNLFYTIRIENNWKLFSPNSGHLTLLRTHPSYVFGSG